MYQVPYRPENELWVSEGQMSKVECRRSNVESQRSECRESKVGSRDFTLLNLLERITHPPAKAVPLFLEENMGNSPLEGGIKGGCDQMSNVECQMSKVEGQMSKVEGQMSKVGMSKIKS